MEIEAALRAHGCRVTGVRRVVWDVLTETGEHLSAGAITSRVHDMDSTINESSVYRTLSLFAELGLIRESRLDETATWEPFHEDTAIHLFCSRCGTVIHHDTELVVQLRRAIETKIEFVPDEIDVRVSGQCSRCIGLQQI